ncbi:MAG: AAA family ATPase [Selenomonadales bacterium]|nr:AAA family ATPase [Selenomonadales bacterium]
MLLRPDIALELKAAYDELLGKGGIEPRQKTEAFRATFLVRFGPDVLRQLSGEKLLSAMHDNTVDSLVYWLEYKNDLEFVTKAFGGIGGGAAMKYGLYRSQNTNEWVAGKHHAERRRVSIDEAIEIARNHRNQLMYAVAALEKLPDDAGDADYIALQKELDKNCRDIANTAWAHKYLHIVFPKRIDNFHIVDWQYYYLPKLLIERALYAGKFVAAAKYAAVAKELGIPIAHLTKTLKHLFGSPRPVWRVQVVFDNLHGWDAMKEGNFVGVNWGALGDLTQYVQHGDAAKSKLQELIQLYYPQWGNAKGPAWEAVSLMSRMSVGHLVLACHRNKVFGIGRVSGAYRYEPNSQFPQQRPVEWLYTEPWELTVSDEGKSRAVRYLETPKNLVDVEKRVREVKRIDDHRDREVKPLAGVLAVIDNVLARKGQVILYGPPGTGKTHWAEFAALELSARKNLNLPYQKLNEDQKAQAKRFICTCCFHPSYGYEDFIEGFRPTLAAGQAGFELKAGVFKSLCHDAAANPDKSYYMLIDEINRGDIPRIFGELIMLVEKNKRGMHVTLPLSAELFCVPPNVYIVGTMNTADRSIALLDTALRRRFGFHELVPDVKVLGKAKVGTLSLGNWLQALNRRVVANLGKDGRNLQVGHAYLMENGVPIGDFRVFARVLKEDIVPLLQEYCYGDYSTLEKILGSALVDVSEQRICFELFEDGQWDNLIVALTEILHGDDFVQDDDEGDTDEVDNGAEDA